MSSSTPLATNSHNLPYTATTIITRERENKALFVKLTLLRKLWRAKCVITKTYELTHFTHKFCSCLDKLYRNALRRSLSGQIVSQQKIVVSNRTKHIVLHKNMPVAALRQCAISRCLDKSDRSVKS